MKPSKFDFTWGESVAVRNAFLETIHGGYVTYDLSALHEMGYPAHDGDPELLDITRGVIERQTGKRAPRHVFLTNGAAGAVTIALRACREAGAEICHLNEPPFFPVYPAMVHAAGFSSFQYGENRSGIEQKKVRLIDSPSNPTAKIYSGSHRLDLNTNVVWDAVYHNRVYMRVVPPPMDYDIMIGSYSKLTGLNGIRVGWIATWDDLLADRIRNLVTAEYCGLSVPSVAILKKYLKDFYWDSFELNANFWLDYNREQWFKLEKFFGGQKVNTIGMFYYAPIDKACRRLLYRSRISWMPGSACNGTDDYGRFNLGQDCKIVKQAVETILKNDKR